jgi:ribose transport system substrate-binding protein
VRRARVALLCVAGILTTTACAVDSGSEASSSEPGFSNVDASAPCTDPLGNSSVPGDAISLTPAEIAEVRAGHYTAAVSWAGTGTWYEAADRGIDAALGELGIRRVASAQANYETATEADNVENIMTRDPDVVIASPVDPGASGEWFRAVADAGKTLILTDNVPKGFTPGDDYLTFVAGNRCQSGAMMADLLASAIGDEGKIGMIFYDANYYVTNILDSTFRASIKANHPNIDIVTEQGFATEAGTEAVASAMLTQHPDLDGLYVTWSAAAQGALAAVNAAGSDVKVVTHDLDAVNDLVIAKGGNLIGTVAEEVYDIGYRMGLLAGYGVLGKKAPPFVAVPVVKVTRDNLVDAWHEVYDQDPPAPILQALGQN